MFYEFNFILKFVKSRIPIFELPAETKIAARNRGYNYRKALLNKNENWFEKSEVSRSQEFERVDGFPQRPFLFIGVFT